MQLTEPPLSLCMENGFMCTYASLPTLFLGVNCFNSAYFYLDVFITEYYIGAIILCSLNAHN